VSNNVGNREQWGSKMGFVLAAAGSAIGLGNIWRFPYITGVNGGAAFVLVYLGCVLLLGLPIMLAELTIGRHSQRDVVGAFKVIKPRTPWVLTGSLGVIAGFLILSYYSVIAGWTIGYFFETIFGVFKNFATAQEVSNYFEIFSANPYKAIGYHALFMFLCMLIVAKGIKGGIERWSKILMPALLAIILILIVRSVTLKGSWEGVLFFIKPDFSKLTPAAIFNALGQSFFSLSLGMGCIITYGSYLPKRDNLVSSGVMVASLDTLIALMAGFVIFPAVFAFGITPDQGPGLVFRSLMNIFNAMPLGIFFGALFFFLLTIAATTSGISLLEVVTAYFVDDKKWSRKKAAWLLGTIIFLIGIPSALSFGVLRNYHLLLNLWLFKINIPVGRFFAFMENLTSNYMLPLGGILISIFAGYIWGSRLALKEIKLGNPKFALGKIWIFLLRYYCPLIMVQILVFGFLSGFKSERIVSFAQNMRYYIIIFDIIISSLVIAGSIIYLVQLKLKKSQSDNK
jgi:NSS family neurotransmitter:Na+ symporter